MDMSELNYDTMVEVFLSEEKAKKYKFNINRCYEVIDEYFISHGVTKIDTGIYVGKLDKDFTTISVACLKFPECEWFRCVVDNFYWRNEGLEIEDRDDCMAAFYKYGVERIKL